MLIQDSVNPSSQVSISSCDVSDQSVENLRLLVNMLCPCDAIKKEAFLNKWDLYKAIFQKVFSSYDTQNMSEIFQKMFSSPSDKSVIILTDLEPDDRRALEIATSYFDNKYILFVGCSLAHSGRKTALTRVHLDKLGAEEVSVVQGTGGDIFSYGTVSSMKAAITYLQEGVGILGDRELQEINLRPYSSLALQNSLAEALDKADPKSIDFIILAPPTDLVQVLKKEPKIAEKIRSIHIMGGWFEKEGKKYTSYNFDMDIDAAADLMAMENIPMYLYSSHLLKNTFGRSVNRDNFPAVIDIIEKCTPYLGFLQDSQNATIHWNEHVMKTIVELEKIIGPYKDHQFTPADLCPVIGMINPQFVKSYEPISIQIDRSHSKQSSCEMYVENNPNSSIRLVTDIDLDIFQKEIQLAYLRHLLKDLYR